MTRYTKSEALIRRAEASIPGGRQFAGPGISRCRRHADFLRVRAAAPNWSTSTATRYIDYVGAWGPMILGHGHPKVRAAIAEQTRTRSRVRRTDRTRSGDGGKSEGDDAEHREGAHGQLRHRSNHVGDPTWRADSPGRDIVVKFAGCYHGHADSLLVKAGSGLLTLGIPNSPGVPADTAKHTLNLPFNDEDASP